MADVARYRWSTDEVSEYGFHLRHKLIRVQAIHTVLSGLRELQARSV
jgi:hypothetical protein